MPTFIRLVRLNSVISIVFLLLAGCGDAAKKASIYKDINAPTVDAYPPAGIFNAAIKVELVCTDKIHASGCDGVYYSFNDQEKKEEFILYRAVIEITQSTSLRYYAKDKVGNVSEIYTSLYEFDTDNHAVTGTTPGARESFVDIALSQVTIRFNKTLRDSTLTADTINIYDVNAAVNLALGTITRVGTEVTVPLGKSLVRDHEYQIRASTAIQDFAGNKLAADFSVSFFKSEDRVYRLGCWTRISASQPVSGFLRVQVS